MAKTLTNSFIYRSENMQSLQMKEALHDSHSIIIASKCLYGLHRPFVRIPLILHENDISQASATSCDTYAIIQIYIPTLSAMANTLMHSKMSEDHVLGRQLWFEKCIYLGIMLPKANSDKGIVTKYWQGMMPNVDIFCSKQTTF